MTGDRQRGSVWLPVLLAVSVLAAGEYGPPGNCFYPSGKEATDYAYVPCNSTNGSGFSSCCVESEGDLCLESGLCSWPKHYVYRGACTDRSWQDGSCPQSICEGLRSNTWHALTQCTPTEYCCAAPDTNCCVDGSALFALDEATSASPSGTGTPSFPTGGPARGSDRPGESGGRSHLRPTTIAAVAGAAGGLIGLAVAAGLIFFCLRRKKRQEVAASHNGPHGPPPVAMPLAPYPGFPPQQQQQQHPPPPHMQHAMPPAMSPMSPPPAYESPVKHPGANPFPFGAMKQDAGPAAPPGPDPMGYYAVPSGSAVESDSRPVQGKPVYEMAG